MIELVIWSVKSYILGVLWILGGKQYLLEWIFMKGKRSEWKKYYFKYVSLFVSSLE